MFKEINREISRETKNDEEKSFFPKRKELTYARKVNNYKVKKRILIWGKLFINSSHEILIKASSFSLKLPILLFYNLPHKRPNLD